MIDRYGNLSNINSFKKGSIPWNKGITGISSGWVKGKSFSEEHKKNLSLSHIGKKDSDETRKKKSLSHIGKNVGPKKRFYYKNLDTGDILYISASKARFFKNIIKI
jgi:hypothetical protein